MTDKTQLPTDLPPYVYGTTRLGDQNVPFEERVRKLIVKIGWQHTDELREVIRQNIDPLGLEGLELGQLCLSGQLAEEYATGGRCYEVFAELKREGLVNRFVLEVFPWSSEVA